MRAYCRNLNLSKNLNVYMQVFINSLFQIFLTLLVNRKLNIIFRIKQKCKQNVIFKTKIWFILLFFFFVYRIKYLRICNLNLKLFIPINTTKVRFKK